MLAIVTRTHGQAKNLQLRLLASCAMATSMISAAATPAVATTPSPLTGADTAFQGIGAVVSGNATIVQTPTMDTITVSTQRTIIDFTPFDTANGGGPITFLPSGRTGIFQNDPNSGVTDFTVLNRIIPTDATRAIRFDGTVQSRIANAIGGSSPGGKILFYSPGGIIASSSAVFDVGSLVLSAADIELGESDNAFSFRNATPGTTVDINNGALLLAQGTGSYVALVAPRVIQSGSVKSDGSIAYIAGEAVDVTIQNNLFDINFVQGTDGGAAVTHNGSTELTRAAGDTSQQRIYVAAVPKNDAITTLISGSLGYTAATQAAMQNGAVILTAGRNVTVDGPTDFVGSAAAANISIGSETSTIFNSSVVASATGDAVIAPAAGTTVRFANDVNLSADRLAEVRAVAGSSAIFDANLTVNTNNLVNGSAARVIATGEVGYGQGGSISIANNLTIDGGSGNTALGELAADLGTITVGGGTLVSASEDNSFGVVGNANAVGGTAIARVGALGSQLNLTTLALEARAHAGIGLNENEAPVPGNAVGGTSALTLGGGALNASMILLDSRATATPGGLATGGTAAISATGGTTIVGTITANVGAALASEQPQPVAPTSGFAANTSGFAANAATMSTVTGGTIQLDVVNSTINVNGDLILDASAMTDNGNGGARGGTININVDNGSLLVGDTINANVSAAESASSLGVTPAAVRGGSISASVVNNGTILASAMSYDANAESGGDALGGTVSLTAASGGVIESIGTISLGAASVVRSLESGGDAVGGNLTVNIGGGGIQSGPLVLDASAVGGDAVLGGVGGSATGGTAQVNISGGDSTIEKFSLTTEATGGRGGNGDQMNPAGGAGGAAAGGIAEVNLTGGTLRTAGFVATSAATGGSGGDGITGGSGGMAIGGRAVVLTSESASLFLMKRPTDPTPTPLASSINASARGGGGGFGDVGNGGTGGMALGGTAHLTLAGADIQPNTTPFAVDLRANAEADGGSGGTSNGANGGAGGNGSGGSATINLLNNHIDFGSVALSTRGAGGSGGSGANSGYGSLATGGAGGSGGGGSASVSINAPAANLIATNIANLAIASEAVGGSGGVGGNGGAGGNAINTGSASFTHTSGMVTVPVAILTTNSFAGRGGLGLGGNGGAGGNSSGGISRLTADGSASRLTVNVAGVTAIARGGFGGDAQANPGTQGGNAGSATGGTAEILATNGATASLALTASADASAFGGLGGIGLAGGGSGGNATGGSSRIDGTNGKVDAALLSLSSDGVGGTGGQAGYGGLADATVAGGNGGSGTGGSATLANIRFASVDAGVDVTADGNGGSGGRGPSGGNGGAATGGSSSFISNNQTNTLGTIFVSAEANGGFGANGTGVFGSLGGNGGTANGGTATINISGGALSTAFVTTRANVSGGNGGFGYRAGNGGNAVGGTAQFSTLAGTTAQIGTLELSARADGGLGASGADGVQEAATIAEATGGTGGNGGNGSGGSALLTSSDAATSLTVSELITETIGTGAGGGSGGAGGITIDAMAGAGGDGGAGGAGVGGTVNIAINGGTAQINAGRKGGPVTIAAGGFGGLGGIGGEPGGNETVIGAPGINGANGDATGGNGTIAVSSAQLNAPNIRFDSDGRGPGNVAGGNAAFSASNGATFVGNSLVMTADAVGLRRNDQVAPVRAGERAAAVPVASATGGVVSVNIVDSTAVLTQTLDLSANAEARLAAAQGGTVNIFATGGTLTTPSTFMTTNGSSFVAGTEIGGRGGDINIRAEKAANGTAGVLNLGSTNLEASGFSTPDDGSDAITNAAAGRISIAAIGGQTTATNFSTLSAQTIGRNSGSFDPNKGIFLNAVQGGIIANGAVSLLSDESIGVSAIGTGNVFIGNDLSAEARNNITVSHSGRSANANTILAANVSLIAGNDVNANPGSRIRSDNDLSITSTSGGVSAGDLVAGDDIAVNANNLVNITGLAQTTGITAMNGESDVSIITPGAVTVNMVDANATIAISAASLAANSLTAGEDIAVLTSGTASVTTASAGDDVDVTSTGGAITLGSVTTSGLGADDRRVSFGLETIGFGAETFARSNILVNAAGDLSVTNATARDTLGLRTDSVLSAGTLVAGEDATFASSGATTLMSVMAGDDIDATAGGAITIRSATSTGTGADDRKVLLPVGSAFFVGENLTRSNIVALSGSNVTLGNPPSAAMPEISAAATLAVRAAGMINASNIAAGEDIALSAAGNIAVGAASAGDDFTASAATGDITLGTITTRGTGLDDRSVDFGGIALGFLATPANGSRIDANAGYGNINLDTLNSAGATSLVAGGAVLGGTSTAGGLLSVMADSIVVDSLTSSGSSVNASARLIDIGSASASLDIIVDTKGLTNSSITLGTATAARDIHLTGGTNGISATSLTAGDDIDIVGAGTVTITNALTTGSFNSGYGGDLSNITINAGSDAMLGTVRAKDNLTVTSVDGTTATMLTADRGAILVNGGTAATITNATATLGSVTINADMVDATTVNASTDVNVDFGASALLGTVTAGNAINVTGTGNAAFTSLTSGDATNIMAGGSVIGGTSTAGGTLSVMADSIDVDALTSMGNSVTASARLVDIGAANAGLDIIVNTKGLPNGSITLGTATAARDISLTAGAAGGPLNPSAMASIFATSLTAGDDIDVFATNNVNIGSALTNGSFNSGYGSDPSNITISTSFMGRADLTTGRAKDNLTISTGIGGANSSGSLTADRGDILVNGQMSANIAQATATVGSVTLNAAFVNAGTVSAGTDANVNFFVNGTLGTVTAARDIIVTGSGPAMLTATSLVAGDDIVVTAGGNATITSARAGSTLRNTSASLTATTLNAGTDLIVLTDMAASLGTASAGARIVTNAGTSIAFTQLMSGTTTSLTAGTSIAGGNANAGTTLSINANGGTVDFGALTSGGSTTITSSNAIMGNSAAAGGALTLNSGANGITATSLSSGSGSNLTVTASNGGNAAITAATSGLDLSVNANNVSVATGTAARDALFTAANNIVAGTTDAGRTVALNAVGTINANTTTAVGDILANSNGNASLVTSTADNIFVVSTGDATLGNASAKTMIGVNAKNVSGTTLTAVEDIRVIASGTANVTTATAGDDFDVSATNGITLGNITVTGTARDDRSLVFNAPAFAVVASPADGSDIRLTSNAAISAANLDAGDDIRIGGGNVTLTGLAKTRGLGVTDTGSDVVINGNAVSVATIDAASNLAVNSESFAGTSLNAGRAITIMTSENQSLGIATAAQGPITGTSVRGTISFVDLSTGGDISLNAGNAIAGGNASAGGSIQLAATNGVNFGGLTSGGLINIGGASVTGGNISADGDVFVSGDLINLGSVSSNFASIFLAGRDVAVGTAGARFDFTVDTSKPANSRIALGDVTVGRDILLTGAATGLTATSLMAGDDIDVDITGNAKIGIAITDGSFNGGYGDHGDEAITARVRNDGYGDWGYGDWGYGSDLSNITLDAAQAMIGTAQARDNVTLTTMTGTMAGTVIAERGDILVNGGTSANIMQSTATLGSITINADAVTADQASAGNAFTVNFLRNASLGTVNAGSTISVIGSGDASLMSLTSGGATAIMAGGSVTGDTSTAGGLLSVMADSIDVDSLTSTGSDVAASARVVDIGTTSAARDALIDTKGLANSSITIGSVNASRDIQLTGGTNGIAATGLTAGDDIDVLGAGNVNITNVLTTGSNSGYGSDLSNITLDAATQAMIGTARARDKLTLTGATGVTATALTADRGAILVNGGPSASIGQATASQDAVTITAGNINAGTVSAETDANFNFGGTMMVGSVTAGNSINVSSNGPSVVISQRTVNISEAIAGLDVIIDTAGLADSSIQLGNVTARRDISLSGATNGLSATTLTAGDDIDVVGAGNVNITNATATGSFNTGYGEVTDPSNLSVTANSGMIMLGNGRAKDNVTLTATGGATAASLTADQGAILVNGGVSANIMQSTATLGSVTINAGSVNAANISAATNANVNFGASATLGAVNAGQAIAATGTGALTYTTLTSGSSTTLATDGAVNGGAASAGSDFIANRTGSFAATGSTNAVGLVSIAGRSVATANVTSGTTTTLTASQGAIVTGNVTGGTGVMLRASDTVSTGTITATANNIDVTAANGITLGSANAGTTINLTNSSGTLATGALTAGNDITVSNGGAINLASASAADDIRVTGGAGVMLGAVSTRGGADQDSDGNDIVIRATGPIAVMSAITQPGALATSDVSLTSTAGSINAGSVTARGAVTAAAATGLTAGSATSGTNIALTGQMINATTLAAATNIMATSSGAMTIGDARAMGGNVSLTAAGALSAMNATATGDVRLTSSNGGNISTGTLSSGSGDIIIASDGNATMTGNSSSGRNLNVSARNLISVGGVANGTAIDLSSTDIMVNTTSGRIGEQGRTTVAQLTNTGTGVTTIGGAGVTSGYSLSNAEAQRIFAGDIIITAARTATTPAGSQASQTLNAAAPDVVLDALTLTGATGQTGATAGNIGATGRLRIETPGKLRTVGAVAISNLATANRFQVNAAQSIEVDAATGSISLSGAGSTLGGTIELTAPSVIAASLTAIGAVAAAVDGRAVNDRLAINDNAISDVGAFSANAIIANVSNGFFVQNSGIKELSAFSFGDRRGITVGAGGLTINAASPATRIFVSGRQLQPNGSFITGVDFLRAQTINGTRIQLSTFPPTPFDPASTVNGCAIITASTCLVTIDGGSLARDVVGQSDDDGGGSSEGSGNSGNDFVRFEFKSLDASNFAPVIDDPVTGVGNDDLYALYDARDCNDDQNLESCAKPE